MVTTFYAIVNAFAKNSKKLKIGKTRIMEYAIETYDYINYDTQEISLDEIISCTLQQEFVLGARAFEVDSYIVVAVLTTPFILKSERDGAKARLNEELRTLFPTQNTILTFDMQVYRNVVDELDEESKQELLELAKVR